jgi:hypothetical protein
MMEELEGLYPGFGGRYNLMPSFEERARAPVFAVPDGRAGGAAAGVSEEEARVGATRSVMDYLIEGALSTARLDPDMSGSMWGEGVINWSRGLNP